MTPAQILLEVYRGAETNPDLAILWALFIRTQSRRRAAAHLPAKDALRILP
jgi:hypothetical protein